MNWTRRFLRLPAVAASVAWTLVIPFLSLMPPSMMAQVGWLKRIPHVDKWIHGGIYGLQTFLFIVTWQAFRPGSRPRAWLGLALASSLYGLLMEVLQRTLTNCRRFSWGDAAANAAGALLVAGGVIICALGAHRSATMPQLVPDAEERL